MTGHQVLGFLFAYISKLDTGDIGEAGIPQNMDRYSQKHLKKSLSLAKGPEETEYLSMKTILLQPKI